MKKSSFSDVWPILMLQGVMAVIFGVFAFVYPGLTLALMVLLFGVYTLLDGVVLLIRGLGSIGSDKHWWVSLLAGLISLAAGAIVFVYPDLTLKILYWIIATWAFVEGAIKIVAAIDLRKEIEDEWLLGLSGLLSIILSILLFARPDLGVVTLGWLVGSYALLNGILIIAVSLRLRKM